MPKPCQIFDKYLPFVLIIICQNLVKSLPNLWPIFDKILIQQLTTTDNNLTILSDLAE